MAQSKQSATKWHDIPKVTPTDQMILIIEETIKGLQLRLSELKTLRKPYYGKIEPLINPATGRPGNGRSKRKKKAV